MKQSDRPFHPSLKEVWDLEEHEFCHYHGCGYANVYYDENMRVTGIDYEDLLQGSASPEARQFSSKYGMLSCFQLCIEKEQTK